MFKSTSLSAMPRCVALLLIVCGLISTLLACQEPPPPPPPSDPPEITAPEVICGAPTEAMRANAAYDVAFPVIQRVTVRIEDPQRDLLAESVRGEINGYPIPTLTDDDADLVYEWSPPAAQPPLVCKGEIVVRFEAEDLDGNKARLEEILTK